jgi:hypothetical protein
LYAQTQASRMTGTATRAHETIYSLLWASQTYLCLQIIFPRSSLSENILLMVMFVVVDETSLKRVLP